VCGICRCRIIWPYVSYMLFTSNTYCSIDCPTYTLSHVLHFNLYIPLGSLWFCLTVSCCCIVLVARKAIFNLVCLNRLVTRLTNGLKYVKVIHLVCGVIVSCCCVDSVQTHQQQETVIPQTKWITFTYFSPLVKTSNQSS
jgi:hypothetical protein